MRFSPADPLDRFFDDILCYNFVFAFFLFCVLSRHIFNPTMPSKFLCVGQGHASAEIQEHSGKSNEDPRANRG